MPWAPNAIVVFISHAGEQKGFALQLEDALKVLGIKSFVDKTGLFAGGNSEIHMEGHANTAPIAITLFSDEFFLKVWITL